MELNSRIGSVVVEGRGVDALLAALSFKRSCPGVEVAVKPTPGADDPVGEVVTPFFLHHLTGHCGIRLADLHRHAGPTLALGFRHRWGGRGEFLRSFDTAPVQTLPDVSCEAGFVSAVEAGACFSLGEALMKVRKVPPPDRGGPANGILGLQIRPDRFADLLRRACHAVGVVMEDAPAYPPSLVIRTDGPAHTADHFLRAGGVPIGRRAVTGLRRRASERLSAFATVETHPDGWSWRIEHDYAVGIGFAYNPEDLSDERARDWLHSKLGEPVGEILSQTWEPGRLDSPWSSVREVSIGDAAGFVAPFTGIRLPLLVLEVQTLCRLLAETNFQPGPETRRLYATILGRARDEIADFTGLYLGHSGRDEPGFWEHAKAEASVGHHRGMLDLFRTAGPSGLLVNAMPTAPGVIGIDSWITSFLGLGIDFLGRGEVSDKDRAAWKSRAGELEHQARRGVEHEQALVAARG